MGLAAPRKKTKISHDPNNTNWSRSTSGFGHKILSSQGWTPGSFLGARNATHADTFTSASASHIRVLVKDDTLGLGARPKRDPLNEPTGLDAFKGLLGRLNGKSDAELQADQRKRDDVKLARYTAMKWQAVRFVRGGLLVQEKPKESSAPNSQQTPQDGFTRDTPKESKRESSVGKDSDREAPSSTDNQPEVSGPDGRREGKKKRKDKKEKRDKKEKKEKKRKRTEPQEDGESTSDHDEVSAPETEAPVIDDVKKQLVRTVKALERERPPIGRHMLRGRHIAQKRKALMDEKSLNEIFMVKS